MTHLTNLEIFMIMMIPSPLIAFIITKFARHCAEVLLFDEIEE